MEEHIKKMIREVAGFGGGRIGMLFNNAGAGFAGYFVELTSEDWDENIRFTSATPGTTITAIWKASGEEPPKGKEYCVNVCDPETARPNVEKAKTNADVIQAWRPTPRLPVSGS